MKNATFKFSKHFLDIFFETCKTEKKDYDVKEKLFLFNFSKLWNIVNQ